MKPLHNRKSPRKQRHDYSSTCGYFVTICTQDRRHYFGEIKNGIMNLNILGKQATDCRNQIPNHYPFTTIHEFVCMPNHIHGIVFLNELPGTGSPGTYNDMSLDNYPTQTPQTQLIGTRQPKSGSLGSVIRGFKIGVTKFAKHQGLPFKRQSRYHDLMVRNKNDFRNFTQYIINNPKKRDEDRFHT